MSEQKHADIFGKFPELGDIIVFNPPKYKGLVFGECMGFTRAGLPRVRITEMNNIYAAFDKDGFYSPKTEFVIVKNNQ